MTSPDSVFMIDKEKKETDGLRWWLEEVIGDNNANEKRVGVCYIIWYELNPREIKNGEFALLCCALIKRKELNAKLARLGCKRWRRERTCLWETRNEEVEEDRLLLMNSVEYSRCKIEWDESVCVCTFGCPSGLLFPLMCGTCLDWISFKERVSLTDCRVDIEYSDLVEEQETSSLVILYWIKR